MLGFKAEEIQSNRFMPFSTDKHKISFDPRSVFNKTDSIEGIVFTEDTPDIRLIRVDNEDDSIAIQDVVKQGRYFVFSLPLAEVSSSNYYLSIRIRDEEVYRKIVAVLAFLAEKPEGYEWSEDPSGINIPEVLRFRKLWKCYDMEKFGYYRYNMFQEKDLGSNKSSFLKSAP